MVRYVLAAALVVPATALLMLFWNALGMRQSYWDMFPLGVATTLLFGALVSVMTLPVDIDAPDD